MKCFPFWKKSSLKNTPLTPLKGGRPIGGKDYENDSLIFHTHRMDIEFVNCNPNIKSQTAQTSDYYQNYFTEYTGEKGVTNVHGSKQVTLKNKFVGDDHIHTFKKR